MVPETNGSFPRHDRYPARTRRSHLIAELRVGEASWIAGRLHEGEPGAWRLEDRSGEVEVDLAAFEGKEGNDRNESISMGDLVELQGELDSSGPFRVRRFKRLVPGHSKTPPGSGNTALWKLPRDLFQWRALMKETLRRFFFEQGFDEVETPILVSAPGQEPYLDPFKTNLYDHQGASRRYLITSPEYAHKRLLTAGFEKIFEIARVFRNGPSERCALHNVEFTMVEWYRAYASYIEIMEDAERLVFTLAEQAGHADVDLFAPPYERVTMSDAFARHARIDLEPFLKTDPSFARDECREGLFGLEATDDLEARFFKIFIAAVEPNLGKPRPIFLIDFPAVQAALSRIRENRPEVCERFELYIHGVELANGFTELNDPDEQVLRFQEEGKTRAQRGGEPIPVDESFLEALRLGMPPAGGVALGLDRLLMILAGVRELREVMPFYDG